MITLISLDLGRLFTSDSLSSKWKGTIMSGVTPLCGMPFMLAERRLITLDWFGNLALNVLRSTDINDKCPCLEMQYALSQKILLQIVFITHNRAMTPSFSASCRPCDHSLYILAFWCLLLYIFTYFFWDCWFVWWFCK